MKGGCGLYVLSFLAYRPDCAVRASVGCCRSIFGSKCAFFYIDREKDIQRRELMELGLAEIGVAVAEEKLVSQMILFSEPRS